MIYFDLFLWSFYLCQAHANGQNVFDGIVNHIGLSEITYFGLMIIKGIICIIIVVLFYY